jgi:hypothetical protein
MTSVSTLWEPAGPVEGLRVGRARSSSLVSGSPGSINSAPTEGVRAVPLSQIRSTFPVLKNPANRHRAVDLTHEQWHYAFTNTFSEDESRALYERYAVPASGGILWGIVLANVQPGHQDAWVDYTNDNRRAAAVHLRR